MKPRWLHELVKNLLSPILIPVQDGPLRGKKWIMSSGSSFVRGQYEPEKTRAIARLVKPNDGVYDVGAHVGYFSVLMSELVGAKGRVFSFEPRGINKRFLKKHVTVNDCKNVEIIDACVGAYSGKARLETRVGTGTGYVSKKGNVEVNMVVLDELIESGRLPKPDFIKVDVEGGEMNVLKGAENLLDKYRPRMILATHSDELDMACQEFLKRYGYKLTDIQQPKGDKEMIAEPAELSA